MSVSNSIDLHLLTNCIKYSDKYLQFIDNCLASGINYLQLRQKNWQFKELLSFGKDLKTISLKYNIPLIINDNLKLAIEINADGIHLGQSDISINEARHTLGESKIIGLSIESIQELKVANQLKSISYVAASSIFPTTTKTNLKKIWGIDELKQFCNLSKHPVVAIGGINVENINQIIDKNVSGIAIISAIHDSPNPQEYIQQLLAIIKRHKNESI